MGSVLIETRNALLASAALAILLTLACSDDSAEGDAGPACAIGSDGCPCTDGGACDLNFNCESGICVPSENGSGGSGGTNSSPDCLLAPDSDIPSAFQCQADALLDEDCFDSRCTDGLECASDPPGTPAKCRHPALLQVGEGNCRDTDCASHLVCVWGGGFGTCEPRVALGESCRGDAECLVGGFCDSATGDICVPQFPEGARCDRAEQCATGLLCHTFCTQAGRTGDACGFGEPPCAEGFGCLDGHVCTPNLRCPGERCCNRSPCDVPGDEGFGCISGYHCR